MNAHGIPTVDRTKIGATPVVRKALLSGEIDLYVEYTGNAGFFFNDSVRPGLEGPAAGLRARRAGSTTHANHIVWLTPARASNAWALAVRRDVAAGEPPEDHERFRPLGAGGGKVVLACSAEFANAGTLRSLEQDLRLHAALRPADRARRRRDRRPPSALRPRSTNGTNTAMVYGTDGGIAAAKLQMLEDDRHDQPIYAPVPIIREAVLKAVPADRARW